jgi:signal transduction histidine kinase
LIDQFQREILFKNIRVQTDFQEPPPVIRGDPSQLEQVIQNLLFNALDAMDKDGQITLETGMQGDFVHITVADDGPGIAPEVLQKLFEPPFTTRPGHLGLGLAICREILLKTGRRPRNRIRAGPWSRFHGVVPRTVHILIARLPSNCLDRWGRQSECGRRKALGRCPC